MATQHIENKLKLLPDQPGCYLMKDVNAKIIYVGKANIHGITKDTTLGHHGVGIFYNIADWTIG